MTIRAADTSEPAPRGERPRIGIACNNETRRLYLHPGDLRRLDVLSHQVGDSRLVGG
jgi:hypothetical protein